MNLKPMQSAPHRKTTEDTRDDWQTPPRIAEPIIHRFGFTGDAAASATNSLAPSWLTKEDDAVVASWQTLGKRVWLNPPYSKTHLFMRRARVESQRGATVVCLVPSTTDVKWYHADVLPYAQEVWFYAGRISFISPVTLSPVSGNPVGSMLVVYHGQQSYAGARIGRLCSKTGLPTTEPDKHFWRRCQHGQVDLFKLS